MMEKAKKASTVTKSRVTTSSSSRLKTVFNIGGNLPFHAGMGLSIDNPFPIICNKW